MNRLCCVCYEVKCRFVAVKRTHTYTLYTEIEIDSMIPKSNMEK